MENASKALIMAGSVLIAIVVISLLVIFFGNLRGLQNTTQSVEQVEQATEFNKQYDAYARDVYGSELLSIANKINDSKLNLHSLSARTTKYADLFLDLVVEISDKEELRSLMAKLKKIKNVIDVYRVKA